MEYNKDKAKGKLPIMSRTFTLLFLLLFLSACATVAPPKIPMTPPVEAEAQSLWDNFILKKKGKDTPRSYTLSGSLRFGYADKTHRVTYILWSNGELPLRLDIQAGIGASVAKIEETEKTLLVYLSQEKRAIMVNGGSNISALLALGMPMPISFLDLSYLLRGDFPHAFSAMTLKNIDLKEGLSVEEKYIFHFENKELFGSLRLNPESLLTECNISNEWQILIEYNENKKPYKLILNSLVEDYKAIMLVKENKEVASYSEEQLKLILPQNTPITVNGSK